MRHPLHQAFVHFPIACWSLAVAADSIGLWLGQTAWGWSGRLLVVGCTMAVLATLAGMVELSRVPESAPTMDAWFRARLVYGHGVGGDRSQ